MRDAGCVEHDERGRQGLDDEGNRPIHVLYVVDEPRPTARRRSDDGAGFWWFFFGAVVGIVVLTALSGHE